MKFSKFLRTPNRRNHRSCSYEKVFFEISQNSQENISGVRAATLLKKSFWHRCFPVNFTKLLRTPFVQNSSGWLLRTIFYWTSPVAASGSFRFPACNFIKKEIPGKMFFCEFCKFIKVGLSPSQKRKKIASMIVLQKR